MADAAAVHGVTPVSVDPVCIFHGSLVSSENSWGDGISYSIVPEATFVSPGIVIGR